jgi:hypothetical protein
VKYEINEVSTNKRCQFPENIVPINETSEQNSNGYCNVKGKANPLQTRTGPEDSRKLKLPDFKTFGT